MTTAELIVELVEIRAYEHRYESYDGELAERGRQIQNELAERSTP